MGKMVWFQHKLVQRYKLNIFCQAFDQHTADKMVALLEDYVTLLQDLDTKTDAAPSELQSYFLPSESISPKEWAEFENVYHMHCPSIFMDAAVRDVCPTAPFIPCVGN